MTLSISLKDKVISSFLAVTHFDLRWIYATRDAFDINSHASLFSMSFTIATNGGNLFFFLPVDMVPTRHHPPPQLDIGRETRVGFPVCRLAVPIPSV